MLRASIRLEGWTNWSDKIFVPSSSSGLPSDAGVVFFHLNSMSSPKSVQKIRPKSLQKNPSKKSVQKSFQKIRPKIRPSLSFCNCDCHDWFCLAIVPIGFALQLSRLVLSVPDQCWRYRHQASTYSWARWPCYVKGACKSTFAAGSARAKPKKQNPSSRASAKMTVHEKCSECSGFFGPLFAGPNVFFCKISAKFPTLNCLRRREKLHRWASAGWAKASLMTIVWAPPLSSLAFLVHLMLLKVLDARGPQPHQA